MKTLIAITIMLTSVEFDICYSNEPVPQNEKYELTVRILNKKGKTPKGNITATVQGKEEIYSFQKEGVLSIPDVKSNDTVNIFTRKHFFQVPVSGLDSINVRFKNSGTIDGFYKNDSEDILNFGYYAVKREDRTTSAVSMNLQGSENYTSLLEFIRGRVAGVEVKGTKLLIRGISSINLTSDPLMIVDGMEMSLEVANATISPREIQSVTIDKIGSMYGSRGANGVIIITTKRGIK